MKNAVSSFNVDHTKMKEGLYISRVDGDITTFDLRMRKPNTLPVLTVEEIHSLEHLLATALRVGTAKDRVIYVGPMGCQTGFYVLMRCMELKEFTAILKAALDDVLKFEYMPGDSLKECGNVSTLNLAAGKKIAKEYLEIMS